MESYEQDEQSRLRLPVGASPLRTIWNAMRPHRGRLVAAGLALLLVKGIELSLGQLLKGVVDGQHPFPLLQGQFGIVVTLVVLLAVQFCTRVVGLYSVGRVANRAVQTLRVVVFDTLLRKAPSYFEEKGPNAVQAHLTADAAVLEDSLYRVSTTVFANGVVAVGGIAFLFWTNAMWALRISALLVFLLPFILGAGAIRRLSAAAQEDLAQLGAFANESISNLRSVLAYNRESFHSSVFSRLAAARANSSMRIVGYNAVVHSYTQIVWFGGLGFFIWSAANDVASGDATAGELASFLYYAALINAAVGTLVESYVMLPRMSGVAEQLVSLLGTDATKEMGRRRDLPTNTTGAISIEDVAFAYDSRPGQLVLRGVSFEVEPRSHVVLVGPSGSGKTTIVELLLRFSQPTSGRILLDGVDLQDLRPEDLRSRIAFVPQQPVLFTGTIAENIRYGRPTASDEEVREAARAACALDFIEGLPKGMGTHLGDVASRLSGGERQRIAIARALLRRSPVVLLDEPTSALDAASELSVQTALQALTSDTTTVTVTHRVATMEAADKVVFIHGGAIEAIGTHAELLASSDRYRDLVQSVRDPKQGLPSS